MYLKRNIIANYIGQIWIASMALVFVPTYIKYLGMESYGLIGIYMLLQSWFILLDMGMTPTLSREMARFNGGEHTSQSIRNLLRSLELLSLIISFLVLLFFYIYSDWMVSNWLSKSELSNVTLSQCIKIIGVLISFRFLEGLYRSAIVGIQDQVWLNIYLSIIAALRGFGSVLILIYISSDILIFFSWQALLGFFTVVGLFLRLNSILPKTKAKAKFSFDALVKVWIFAKGMILTTLLSLMLTHSDKLFLSKLLSLSDFGEYTFAWAIGNTILLLVTPVSQAYGPKFTELIALKNLKGLVFSYHQGSQLMTLMVVPAALMLIFFSQSLLMIWTNNHQLSVDISPLVSIIAIGTTFNALMHLPYMLQLSYGWSNFAAKVNFIELFILLPGLYFMVPRYGAAAAALIWMLINASYILIVLHIMHRFILPKEKYRWYLNDFLYPTIPPFLIILFFKLTLPEYQSRFVEFLILLGVGLLAFTSCFMASSIIKSSFFKFLRSRMKLDA